MAIDPAKRRSGITPRALKNLFDFFFHVLRQARLKAYVPALDREVEGTVRNTVAAPSFADIRMARENGQADITSFKVRIDVVPPEGLLTG